MYATRPPSVERVVSLNLLGAAEPGPVRELDANALGRSLGDGLCLLGIRDPESFDAGHLDGSINLPAGGRGLGTRAGWATGTDELIVLISPSLDAGQSAAALLRAAGVWNLAVLSVADPLRGNQLAFLGGPAGPCSRIASCRASERGASLIDVRDPAEWSTGHIPGSRSLPLAELGDGRDTALALRATNRRHLRERRTRGHDPVWRVSGGVEQLARRERAGGRSVGRVVGRIC